jgi:hypothetical protein
MDENRFDRNSADPADRLSPALRRAVDGIVRDPLPDDVTRRALAAARQIGVPYSGAAGPALQRRPRAAWRVLAVAASIGLVAGLVWWRWGGPPDGRVVVQPPVPSGPGNVQPLPQRPETPRGDRLPSLWAYRQAAGQSAEALDAMLDQDARDILRPEPHPFQAGAPLGFPPQTL